MSCSCRAVPWRAFVQGLAQVHKVEGQGGASLFGRQIPNAQLVLPFRPCSESTRQLRSFYASSHRAQGEAATTLASVEESSSTSTADSTTPRAGEERNSPSAKGSSNVFAEAGESLELSAAQTRSSADDEASRNRDFRAVRAKSKEEDYQKPRSRTAHDNKRDPIKQNRENTGRRDGRTEAVESDEIAAMRAKKPDWQIQKQALKEKFPEGWNPRKRLSPDALAGIRALNAQFPDVYTTSTLAAKFEVSPEAIRRILKSKWQPTVDEEQKRQERWFKRGMQVWERKAALGIKPPKKWRQEGIARDPSYHEWSKRASERERNWEDQEKSNYRAQIEKRKQSKQGWASRSDTAGRVR